MITIRRSGERGHIDHGWLDTRHTFSFADYHDPEHVHFGALRVINEDRVLGGQGFGRHGHRDMEIISYVISGTLEHEDSLGHRDLMRAGDVQQFTAGTGIEHSERNVSLVEPVHFLQIWLLPDRRGLKPGYANKSFGVLEPGRLHLIASRGGREGSLSIHQDADVYAVRLSAGDTLTHGFEERRQAWVQLISGELTVNGERLDEGDGAAITGEDRLQLAASRDAHFLLFDLEEDLN